MKNKLNYIVLALALVFAGCSPEQDVSPIVDPTAFPNVTVEADIDLASLTEGDVITFTISTDARFNQDIDFGVAFNEGSAFSADDIAVSGGTFEAYTTETTMTVEVLADFLPEEDEAADFSVDSSDDPTYNFQINPEAGSLAVSTTIENVNSSDAADVTVDWTDGGDDWDVYINDAGGDTYDASESGGHPEFMNLDNTEADGTYYVTAFPWAVEADVTELEVRLGSPDGSVSVQTITIDLTADPAPAEIGGNVILAKLTKSGSSYTLVAGNTL